jgi:hypothetical protein
MVVAAGQRITANTFGQTKSDTQNVNGTFTSTSYVETLSAPALPCSLTFVAPKSGEVIVSNTAFVDNSTTARTYCAWIIREGGVIGSGVTFLDAGDEDAITNITTDDSRFGCERHVTGLTPGATYNIRQKFKVSTASTGSVQWKHLIVKPVI